MVFLIQRTQNKDGLAIQLKLNELVAALEGAATGSSTWRISRKRTCRSCTALPAAGREGAPSR
jgi:low affinity Fe/Cu permease